MAESVCKMRMQKETNMMKIMLEMQKQLSSMNNEIVTLKEKNSENKIGTTFRKIMCEKCKSDNQNYCNHCVKCGKTGHIARGCSLNSKEHS